MKRFGNNQTYFLLFIPFGAEPITFSLRVCPDEQRDIGKKDGMR
ncbi:hypothetical protein [Algoriphagus sp. NG3]|nr:hypothetical protein [Algoriphagus sp. NG3]WPR75217.1 hypothetical protein SLW71_21380 [Algoriphagus sp. NG3]